MQNPLVTISIPIFKCENFIERCLDSVLAQTYTHIELHLVNDQTSDNSIQVIENYFQKNTVAFPVKLVHNEENSGLSVVRNRGIDEANGKYLFFLDSDDTITPNCIEKLVKTAEQYNSELTFANLECVNQKTLEISNCITIQNQKKSIESNQEYFLDYMNGTLVSYAVNKLLLVEFFREQKIYFIKGLFAQDELWSFHAAQKVNSAAIVQDSTYQYYLHENSVIHNRNKRNFDNWITIGEYFNQAYTSEKNSERKRKILQFIVDYKHLTLQMNWKAQHNDDLWKYSYTAYKKLSSLSFFDYFSSHFSADIKKKNLLDNLPTSLGLYIFKKRWGN